MPVGKDPNEDTLGAQMPELVMFRAVIFEM